LGRRSHVTIISLMMSNWSPTMFGQYEMGNLRWYLNLSLQLLRNGNNEFLGVQVPYRQQEEENRM
jgi:hypothetical protein